MAASSATAALFKCFWCKAEFPCLKDNAEHFFRSHYRSDDDVEITLCHLCPCARYLVTNLHGHILTSHKEHCAWCGQKKTGGVAVTNHGNCYEEWMTVYRRVAAEIIAAGGPAPASSQGPSLSKRLNEMMGLKHVDRDGNYTTQ